MATPSTDFKSKNKKYIINETTIKVKIVILKAIPTKKLDKNKPKIIITKILLKIMQKF